MGIHMKLKDRRTFLLGGAFLLFLLLFAMMSSVAAADDNSQVVCENSNNNSSLNAEINNADVMEFNNTNDKIVIENVIKDVVIINNSTSSVCIVNSTINTIIINNSKIYDLSIKNSKTCDLTIWNTTILKPSIKDGSLLPCNDSEKKTRSHMVGGGVIVPSFIEVIFNKDCNYPDEIHGWDGSTVHFTAAVKTYEFFWIYSDPIGHGKLSLLKDGKVIDIKDLSENSTPTFSLKIEKGHTYALMYEGGYSQESSWYYYHYEPSSKTLDVHYKDDYWLWKG